MKKNKLVILIGPPGSGKGAQAMLLSDRKKIAHLAVSKILEKKFKEKGELEEVEICGEKFNLKEQERRWREGLLCDDEFVTLSIKEDIEKLREKTEIVLIDGYPRTVNQAKLASASFFNLYNKEDIVTISLEVGKEESVKRNTQRRVCSLMRHSIIDHPETRNLTICPLDGSSLERRALDDPETIKVRLDEFKEKTAPVLDCIEGQGIGVFKVNGEGTISEVFDRVLEQIEKFEKNG